VEDIDYTELFWEEIEYFKLEDNKMVAVHWKMFVSLEMELMVLLDNLMVVEADTFGYNCN
jgi:hypothetical protein